MKEKSSSFVKLAQTYSEIFSAETRYNLSLEGKNYLSIKWMGKENGKLYPTK
jgi:hypothetical protein